MVLFNGARLTRDHYPSIFKNWNKIFFEDIVDIGSSLPNGVSPCSPYIGLNLLMVNPWLAIVDENQDNLRFELMKHNIESIALKMRHARSLSGGFHCVTLDVKRKGERQDYFENKA